jgi:hypothetical protein
VFDRRTRDRRCEPAHRTWGRRCDGSGRNGIPDLPACDGGILRVARAVDRFQRDSEKSVAPLRPGTRKAAAPKSMPR